MTPIQRVLVTAMIACAVSTAAAATPAAATPSGGRASQLTVTIRWSPGVADTWTLACDPVGGTHPGRVRACAFLDGLADPFSTKPTGMACSMIYSGPERARVVGRWKGKPVDYRFARNDGCATALWQKYRALLSDPGVVMVQGRVDLGPTCPVQRPDQSCTTLGAPATVTATSGTQRVTTQAGPDGFRLRLARGVWWVTADAGMSCQKVRLDTRTRPLPQPLILPCDTGIRARA